MEDETDCSASIGRALIAAKELFCELLGDGGPNGRTFAVAAARVSATTVTATTAAI